MLENTEGIIKKGKSRETGNINMLFIVIYRHKFTKLASVQDVYMIGLYFVHKCSIIYIGPDIGYLFKIQIPMIKVYGVFRQTTLRNIGLYFIMQ